VADKPKTYRTKTGRTLTDADIQAMADEAERGYDVAALKARQSRIKSGRPQTNGHVERLHRTLLEECWRPAFARFMQVRYRGLQRELAESLRFYNFERAHTGRITAGRCPAELVYGARKMEPG